MAAKTVIKHRRDTAANWTSTNPVLAAGELGVETDTLKSKIGDGTTAWTSLAYIKSGNSDTTTLATTTSKIRATSLDRTLYVQTATPTGMVTGDIWIQV